MAKPEAIQKWMIATELTSSKIFHPEIQVIM
jgi:hypothetical protein